MLFCLGLRDLGKSRITGVIGPRLKSATGGWRNMNRLALVTSFAVMSLGMAHADIVTLEEHSSGDDPTINLSTILNQWGTPGDPVTSPSDSDSAFFTSGLSDVGTNDLVGLNLINDTGLTITSLQVFAYGQVSGGSLDYNCGVNNFFTGCTPGSGTTVASGTFISQGSPVEWNYSGTGGSDTGISNGTEFRLVDSVDGLSGTSTALFYEIEINGNPPTNPSAVPEPMTMLPLGAGLLALGLVAGYKRRLPTN
jgi:hypothetical protein